MTKDEILKISRKENSVSDERTEKIKKTADDFSSAVFLCIRLLFVFVFWLTGDIDTQTAEYLFVHLRKNYRRMNFTATQLI